MNDNDFIEMFGDNPPTKAEIEKARKASGVPALPMDDPLEKYQTSNPNLEYRAQKIIDDALVKAIGGDLPSAPAAIHPAQAPRMSSDWFSEFRKSVTADLTKEITQLPWQDVNAMLPIASEHAPECDCSCDACTEGNCSECSADEKCEMCMQPKATNDFTLRKHKDALRPAVNRFGNSLLLAYGQRMSEDVKQGLERVLNASAACVRDATRKRF